MLIFKDGWKDRWVKSTHKGGEAGKWEWTAGEFYNDAEADKGKLVEYRLCRSFHFELVSFIMMNFLL